MLDALLPAAEAYSAALDSGKTTADALRAAAAAEGAKATAKLPWPMPLAPNKPEPVEATKNEDGSVTLTWPKISGAAFYRIYRESTNYASRYDVAPGSENPGYTDTDATVAHSYWVTAVNSNMHESAPVGPVTK